MENALVSIIVPVYNVEPYIDECLISLSNQKYKNIEIIVVNDGSVDDTEEKVQEWCKRDQRIRLYTQLNEGVSVARNNGLRYAKGQFIVFVDGDDWVNENYISTMYSELLENDADVVKCGFRFIDTLRGKVRQYKSKGRSLTSKMALIEYLCGKGISSSVCGSLYKSSLFSDEQMEFASGVRVGEDGQMTLKILSVARKIRISAHILYNIRVRQGSASRESVLGSDECKVFDTVTLPASIDEKYKKVYILRVASSLLIKNAFRISKSSYKKLYENLNYCQINKSDLRSYLPFKWRAISIFGKRPMCIYYSAKLLSFFKINPIF